MKRTKTISKVRLLAIQGDYIMVLEKMNGKYSLPGGTIEKKETEYIALLREVQEEVGLILSSEDLRYAGSRLKIKKYRLVYKTYFFYQRQGIQPQNMEDHKFKNVSWKLWYNISDQMDLEDSSIISEHFSNKMVLAN